MALLLWEQILLGPLKMLCVELPGGVVLGAAELDGLVAGFTGARVRG